MVETPTTPMPPPVLQDYEAARRDFTWEDAREALDGLPAGGLNIAHEAVDRHVAAGRGDVVALRCLGRHGGTTEVTYGELARRSSALAHVLRDLGVRPGDRVFTLLGRVPDLYVTALATWKVRAVLAPLFAAFGPEPVRQRLRLGEGSVLVTTPELYARRIAAGRDELPDLREVLLVHEPGAAATRTADVPDTVDLDAAVDEALLEGRDTFTIEATDPGEVALLHFTSGTTGTPKGALHVHGAVVAHHATAASVLDLHPGDVYWCTADPGWVTGTSYGVVAPLVHGVTSVVDAAEFDARRWYRILQEQRVNVWYTAPTALRMLVRSGAELAHAHDLSALRHVASVGEPLNAEVVVWGEEAFGLPVRDTWWQTETGAIMLANFRACEVRPGSMGRPVPGVEAAVLVRGEGGRARVVDGRVEVLRTPGEVGELALRTGWPSMFAGYLHDEERYRRSFADGWYLCGDLASVDEDGWFWFVGRSDDVIKSAGHLVGPFEVESALMEHPAVAEVGVIGRPDPVAGEVVKAFVTVRDGFAPDEDLRAELLAFGRRRLGSVAPREIAFDPQLPHTRSGKVMRRLLKARELGLPEGDVSTLEGAS